MQRKNTASHKYLQKLRYQLKRSTKGLPLKLTDEFKQVMSNLAYAAV